MRAERWVVYSTFDVDGLPDEPSVAQLLAYAAAGFKTIVVDTSPVLSQARRDHWNKVATRWKHRGNIGYDFASFKFGLEYLEREEAVDAGRLNVVFTNDSCFGPFASISSIIEKFDQRVDAPNVVYGITDSLQETHHIQSYWLYFRAGASRHAFDFFSSMPIADGRAQAIIFGELGLSAYLRSRQCEFFVLCPWRQTVARMALVHGRVASTMDFLARRVTKRWKYSREGDTQCLRWLLGFSSKMQHFNPALLFGVQMVKYGHAPFLKKSILRENLFRSPDIPPGLETRGLSNADVCRLLGIT